MVRFIDDFLNNFTMYRVVLYGLRILAGFAIAFGFLGMISFSGISLALSLLVLVLACQISNKLFSRLLHAPINTESHTITGLILFFIMIPAETPQDYMALILASVIAMGSKYLFAIKKKHLFNPAAIAVFLLGLFGSSTPLWWMATPPLLPITLVIGLLIVRKVRSFSMFFAFLIAASGMIIGTGLIRERNMVDLIQEIFLSWPVIFFGTVMLTEPLTAPALQKMQIIFGVIVGILFGAQFQFGPLFSTPEFALIIGNIFAYIVNSKQKLFLHLKEKIQHSQHMYDFVFTPNQKLAFLPGQYVEWTLPHKSDNRGNRRYFTIASSPTEPEVHLGVRIQEKGSSFKKALVNIDKKTSVTATHVSGEFTLPDDKKKKLVFIAGGIGITPFRSMMQYLLDKNQKRDIILFYTNSNAEDFIYKNIFDKAQKTLDIQTHYVVTNKDNAPKNWNGLVGRLTEQMIKEEVTDYSERTFYLSGPQTMIRSYKDLLLKIGIKKSNIVTDYFPGF